MEDVIGQITIYTFMIVGVAFPVFVIAQSIVNFVRASDGRGTIALKALVVLAVWSVLSLIFVSIVFMYVFEHGGVDQATANRRITIMSVVFTLIYAAVGLVLAYWVRLQPGWRTLRKAKRVA